MPNANITNIIPPRVPFLDASTGLISREWFRFLFNVYTKVEGSSYSLDDLQVSPPASNVAVTALSGDNTDLTTISPRRTDFRRIDPPLHKEGRVFYSAPDYALSYYNENDEVTVTLGREQLVRVYNNSGSLIANGKACYINGAYGTWPTISLAQADTYASSHLTIGLATCDIPNNEYGYICTSGVVNDVNTTGFPAGSVIYLSATTAGNWTLTQPLQPNFDIIIGFVLYENAAGKIYVHVDKEPWFPSLEVLDTTATVTLPTTATVFVAPTVSYNDGFTYNTTTGVVTFSYSGSHTLTLVLNASPSAANKNVYFYIEEDTGSGWTPVQYSARLTRLANAVETQVTLVASQYYAVGTQLRFYIWGDATVNLKTTDLPGTTAGTVTLAAFHLMIA